MIAQAEKGLARLAAEAADSRDYAGAGALLALAQRIAESARELGFSGVTPAPAHSTPAPMAPPLKARPSAGAIKKSDTGYPRFKREGDTLVKIGYSKSERSVYEHRAPRDVLTRLLQKMRRHGGNGDRFTMEQLMPLHDAQGRELPSYQAYLCLAWLVSAGLLAKHGRQGYTLAPGTDLDGAVDTSWQSLPTR